MSSISASSRPSEHPANARQAAQATGGAPVRDMRAPVENGAPSSAHDATAGDAFAVAAGHPATARTVSVSPASSLVRSGTRAGRAGDATRARTQVVAMTAMLGMLAGLPRAAAARVLTSMAPAGLPTLPTLANLAAAALGPASGGPAPAPGAPALTPPGTAAASLPGGYDPDYSFLPGNDGWSQYSPNWFTPAAPTNPGFFGGGYSNYGTGPNVATLIGIVGGTLAGVLFAFVSAGFVARHLRAARGEARMAAHYATQCAELTARPINVHEATVAHGGEIELGVDPSGARPAIVVLQPDQQ